VLNSENSVKIDAKAERNLVGAAQLLMVKLGFDGFNAQTNLVSYNRGP
jgi:hypothetical protein